MTVPRSRRPRGTQAHLPASAVEGTIDRIVTARMLGERLAPEHADDLARLLLRPEVVRTTWPFAHPPTADDVTAALRAKIEHWNRHGFGLWLLRDRLTREMVGRGGLQSTYAPGLVAVEAAWAIMPERWGQGLGTELARAALRVGFQWLELPEIVALTLPDNVASRRVMEKAGFRYEREIDHAGLPHVLYRCDARAGRPSTFPRDGR
jgi:ribosomal-protein-alanine N-acetyltransferase